MKHQTLKFLGRDSGFGKMNNSAYCEIEDKLILIDCGYTVFNDIKEKFDFNKYESINVIITHLHNDHAGSLSQLILYLWIVFNKKVNIFSNCINIKTYWDITGVPPEAYILNGENDKLKFIKTEHTPYIDAYGFLLSVNNKTIAYTGDTNTLTPFLIYIDKIEELYIDVSRFGGAHIKIDDVLDKLNEIKSKGIAIFLMHIDDKDYIKGVTNNQFYVE